MKSKWLCGVAGAALIASATSLRPANAQPAVNWTGFYAGFYAGGVWGRSEASTNLNCGVAPAGTVYICDNTGAGAASAAAINASGSGKISDSAFTGGMQIGYLWQFGTVVYGLETDFGAFNLSGSRRGTGAFPDGGASGILGGSSYTISSSFDTDWLFTFRGRVGTVLPSNLLAYVTGGLAVTRLNVSFAYSDNAGTPSGIGSGSASGVKTGWTVGAGLEWAVSPRHGLQGAVDFGVRRSHNGRAMNSWFDRILFYARTQPETPALIAEDRVVTFGMLGAGIERCAGHIAAMNVPCDAPVAVVTGDPIRHLTLCLGLIRCGIVSTSLDAAQLNSPGMTLAAVIGDEKVRPAVEPRHRFVSLEQCFETEPLGIANMPAGFTDGSSICRVNLTSGSTGEPKVIRHSLEDIGRRTEAIVRFDWKRALCLPGLSSSWGFWTACMPLAFGGATCFSGSPFQSLRMIELFAIEYVTASTEQLLALTRAARTSASRLTSLRFVEIAGSAPTRALIESAMSHVCKDIYCKYGASESGPMSFAHAREIWPRPDYAGHVLPSMEVAVVDRDGRACPSDTIGLIRCRTNPRGESGKTPPPWIEIGDAGWIAADGKLHVAGRAADVALGAQASTIPPLSPVTEAEHILRLEWDAADAAATLLGHSVSGTQIGIATVDCRDASAEKLEALMRAREFDCTIRLLPMPAIPRLASGKIDRRQLQTLIAARSGPHHMATGRPYTIRLN
ncbi:MAG: AMP-binding protein [Xanthobacteraceae bacterium]|nr:AMP-binding protein [Xanthobacteraceae bacterium]